MDNPRFSLISGFPSHKTPQRYQPCNFQYNNNKCLDYWCDTCDKGFVNQNLLDKHRSQHQVCNIDGCQFVAHPKVITRHIQMQHSTGLYSRIVKSQDPEEIKKWREERKNKYPTKANIEKNNAIWKEKMDRGEKMQLNHRSNKQAPGNSIPKKPHYKNLNLNNHTKNKNRKVEKTRITNVISPIENKKTLKPFCGIRQLLENEDVEVEQKPLNFHIEDDDWVSEPSLNAEEKNNVCNALLTLVSNYDSADEQEQNSSALVNIDNNKNKLGLNKTNAHLSSSMKDDTKIVSEDDSPPEEETIGKQDTLKINEKLQINKPEKRFRKLQSQSSNIKRPAKVIKKQIPSTLLHKLLSKEIKMERNIILQCIRHIVKNNYFKDKLNK